MGIVARGKRDPDLCRVVLCYPVDLKAGRLADKGGGLLGHGFVASAPKHLSFSITCASVKAAATSVSVKPLFGCPE